MIEFLNWWTESWWRVLFAVFFVSSVCGLGRSIVTGIVAGCYKKG